MSENRNSQSLASAQDRWYGQCMATITIRKDALTSLLRLARITTDREFAECIGMNPSSVSRILNGTQAPGTAFIASVCFYFGTDLFEDLFDIVSTDEKVVAR